MQLTFGNGGCGTGNPITGGGMVYTNLFVQPINLSWKLGGGWFIGDRLRVHGADGHAAGGGLRRTRTTGPSSRRSRSPTWANNWVASANFFYDINTRSRALAASAKSTITSGNLFYGDFTRSSIRSASGQSARLATSEIQTTADTGAAAIPAPGVSLCGRYKTAAAGALVGYDFGPVDLQVWVTDNFIGQRQPGRPRRSPRVVAHRLQDLGI